MLNRSALLALALALILWSVTFPIVRGLLPEVPIEVLLALRFSLAALALFAYWLVQRKPLPRGRDFWLAALSGFCCVTVYQMLSTYGLKTVKSAPASVLVDTMPIFATLLSVLFLKQRPHWRTWTGMAIAFCGSAVIALGENPGHLDLNLGALLLLAAALVFSLGTIAQKPIMKRNDPLSVTTVSFAAGALGMFLFSPGLSSAASQIPSRHLASIAFLAIGPGAIAYALWAFALSKLPVAKVSGSVFLIPPMTFFVAWAFYGEIPGLITLIGATFALTGVVLVHSDQTT